MECLTSSTDKKVSSDPRLFKIIVTHVLYCCDKAVSRRCFPGHASHQVTLFTSAPALIIHELQIINQILDTCGCVKSSRGEVKVAVTSACLDKPDVQDPRLNLESSVGETHSVPCCRGDRLEFSKVYALLSCK